MLSGTHLRVRPNLLLWALHASLSWCVIAGASAVQADGIYVESHTIGADLPHPKGAPTAVIHVPAHVSPQRPIHLVVLLHGWNGCASAIAYAGKKACAPKSRLRRGWGLADRHAAANTNSIFIVPQLAYLRRSSSPGRFSQKGVFRKFLEDILTVDVTPRWGDAITLRGVASVTLVAHSAGYKTALAVLESGGLEEQLKAVVLMDALYGGIEEFARWSDDKHHRLLSIYTGQTTTRRNNGRLKRQLGSAERGVVTLGRGALPRVLKGGKPALVRTLEAHGRIPHAYLTEAVRLALAP